MASQVSHICSLLFPWNSGRTSYHGYIQPITSSQSYELCLSLPERGALEHARLEVDWKLRELLGGHLLRVQKRLQSSSSVSSFMVELQNIIERLVEKRSRPPLNESVPPAVCHKLISDLRNVGWQNIVYVSPQLTLVKIMTSDERSRHHVLNVQLSPTQYPDRDPSVTADTPQVFQPKWSSSYGLVDLVKQFTKWLTHFQTFWDTLDEFDTKTWVLEPERPTRADTYRRVVIGHNLSICLDISPTQPLRVPDCTFLGPDNDIVPLKQKLNSIATSKQWNLQHSLLDNLSVALGLHFPTHKTAQDEGMINECEICYAYQLRGCVPDITCDHCAKPFHYDCLYEWLKTVNIGKHQKTNVVIGECPYCCKRLAISCKGRKE